MSTPKSPATPSVRHSAASADVQPFADVIACLRAPDGCPWDRAQTHASLKKYAVEETYELLDAIDAQDDVALCEELGDVLLQVVLHAQVAADRDAFTLQDVIDGITAKMVRRHPHVFGDDEARAADPEEVVKAWGEIKAAEGRNTLDGVPRSMPPVLQAIQLSERAARVGFDFPTVASALEKLQEEVGELAEAIASDEADAVVDELGDVLFAAVNVGRKCAADAGEALAGTLQKFRRRFGYVERALHAVNRAPTDATLDEMETLWQASKAVVP